MVPETFTRSEVEQALSSSAVGGPSRGEEKQIGKLFYGNNNDQNTSPWISISALGSKIADTVIHEDIRLSWERLL